jgi:ribonuclease/clavin/mitogillin
VAVWALEELPPVRRQEVPGETLPPYRGTNCYWVPDDGGLWLIDTGDGSQEALTAIREGWQQQGAPPMRGILVTHWHRDHTGGAEALRVRWGAPVYAHRAELPQIARAVPGLRVDPWPEGNTLGGAEVLHAPGHTRGQVNLWFPETRLLLSGDNVLGASTSVVVPPDGHLRQYEATIRRLLSLGPAVIGPGHGPVVLDGARRLEYYLTHRREREEQILQLFRDRGSQSARELAEAIYAGEPPETIGAGTWMITGHLAALEEEGRLRKDAHGRYALEGPV